MKELYITIFKQYFRSCLIQMRNTLGLTQTQMAEKLNINCRAYASLEGGHSCCNAITLVFFLLLDKDNHDKFLEDLRQNFANIYETIP